MIAWSSEMICLKQLIVFWHDQVVFVIFLYDFPIFDAISEITCVLSVAITLLQKSDSTCEAYCIWTAYYKTEPVSARTTRRWRSVKCYWSSAGEQFPLAISWRQQIAFWWNNYDDYDDACFVLDQNAHMEF